MLFVIGVILRFERSRVKLSYTRVWLYWDGFFDIENLSGASLLVFISM